jgi:hypothetical protein
MAGNKYRCESGCFRVEFFIGWQRMVHRARV